MKILVCNAGSTSLKFKLYDMPDADLLATGKVERVGSTDDAIFGYENCGTGFKVEEQGQNIPDYKTGIEKFLAFLTVGESQAIEKITDIDRVGYKSVLSKDHYGVHEIDEGVLQGMRDFLPLAPVHNSAYLGGSCSICAILDGKSVDTSFGMSLETGLIHANRVGDMDPTMIHFLKEIGLTEKEILDGCQKKGGLLGISGVSNDLRYVQEAADVGNQRAKLALDVFVTGIVHYIGSFYLDLGRLDDLVFTAGIGEHSARIREMVCEKLAPPGGQAGQGEKRGLPR